MVLGFCSLAVAQDDLKAVEKKIIAGWEKHKSTTAKFTSVTHIEMGEVVSDSKSHGTLELMRKGDKWLLRQEMKTVTTQKFGEQENKMEQEVLSIMDGEYAYTLTDMAGQKMAFKTKIDPKTTGDPTSTFETLRKDHELKLLPEETIDGSKVYVIEATPKEKATAGYGKTVYYYQQESGVLVKMVAYGEDGKPQMTMTYTDIKLDVDIKPERFVFKAPPGVEVIDQTSVQP
jgi:outer membrane lipoprotein-sorting protein